MSEPETVIVAHERGKPPKRSFYNLERARQWADAVDRSYTLSEVLIVE